MASDDALALLRSIDASLKKLVGLLAPAPTVDLDGKYGNPMVKFDPYSWKTAGKPTRKGRLLSQCEPEFLDALADASDYFAAKAEEKDEHTDAGKPIAPMKRLDAARARGWAARLRAGWAPTAAPASPATDAGGAHPWASSDDDEPDF